MAGINVFLGKMGKGVQTRLRVFVEMVALSTLSVLSIRRLNRKSLGVLFRIALNQVYFTAWQALPLVSIVALLLGFVAIGQAASSLQMLGADKIVAQVLVLVIIRELGPLLTGIMVIGRSGTAIAVELGTIQVNREMKPLQAMGIDPLHYIMLPRIAGGVVSVLLLVVSFDVISLIGAFFFAKIHLGLPFAVLGRRFLEFLSFSDLLVTVVKATVFGLIVVITCTYRGLAVRGAFTEVPQAGTKGVVAAMLGVFVLNALISLLIYM